MVRPINRNILILSKPSVPATKADISVGDDLLETLNASVREVNAMVDSYGSYQPEDMGRYHQEPQNGALQQGSDGPQNASLSAAAPEGETQQSAAQAVSARYVICPKCGERIEIGGM